MNNLVLSLAPKFTKLQTLCVRINRGFKIMLSRLLQITAMTCRIWTSARASSLMIALCLLWLMGVPNLIKLNISGCTAFSDMGLAYLAQFCRKLKYLNLCGCVKAASDKALKTIGHNCRQLQSLNLGWCENVGDVGVMSLAYGSPDLRALDLCGCVLITDLSGTCLKDKLLA